MKIITQTLEYCRIASLISSQERLYNSIRTHYFSQLSRFISTQNRKNQMEELATLNTEHDNPTAGIIIIGDEILKGQTQDTNTYFLAKQLHSFGVKLKKVSVIPDDLQTIAAEVAQFSARYTFVLTSGGIGPTHDDITVEGVAAAFGEKVVPHPMLVGFIKAYFKTDDLTSPAMKMAHIPESAVLSFGEDKDSGIKSRFPLISVRNVTIFPGIPHLLEKSFGLLGKKLFHREGMGFLNDRLYLATDEVTIASVLNETVAKFSNVSFGSYPKLFHSYYKTMITLESLDSKDLDEAKAYFIQHLPDGLLVNFKPDPISSSLEHLDALLLSDTNLQGPVKEALSVINQCFDQYKPEEISIFYNGGKDCLAVLHLMHSVMKRRYQSTKLQAVYIMDDRAFPQVTEFVQQSINRYDLDCVILQGPMKEALSTFLQQRPQVKAVLMGTRCTDPHSAYLKFFSPTDDGWSPMMRVNPILNWDYDHVWRLIRGLYLPYCSLYDRGYTSLGSQDNTMPNPVLQTKDRLDQVTFLPAYMLTQHHLERKGRINSKH